jgi:uncharacterized protein YjiK
MLLFANCSISEDSSEPETQPVLVQDFEVSIDVEEPSGLTYDPNTQTLWTVNDPPNNQIYNISLSGDLLQILDFVGDDLEGVAYDNSNNTLWVAEEGNSEIVNVSLQGDELQRIEVPYTSSSPNSGLEGLCIGPAGDFFLLKEKDPGIFIKFSSDFLDIQETELTFADDFSGISYDASRAAFWIVSDESETLYLWDEINGVREQYLLDFPKAEGIVYIADTGHFYMVSDSEQKLYKFHLEGLN